MAPVKPPWVPRSGPVPPPPPSSPPARTRNNWRSVKNKNKTIRKNYTNNYEYQWVSPQENEASGHFRYRRRNTKNNINNAPFNIRQVGALKLSDRDLSDAFENVMGKGETTFDFPGLPIGSEFGWSDEENKWIYKSKNTKRYYTSNYKQIHNNFKVNDSNWARCMREYEDPIYCNELAALLNVQNARKREEKDKREIARLAALKEERKWEKRR